MERPNILLSKELFGSTYGYKSRQAVVRHKMVERDRESHARVLTEELDEAIRVEKQRREESGCADDGICLDFCSALGVDYPVEKLEDIGRKVRLLNVREVGGQTCATVFVPNGKEGFHSKKVREYGSSLTPKGKPKNQAIVTATERVCAPTLESFWLGNTGCIPGAQPVWVEVWVMTGPDSASDVEAFFSKLDSAGIAHGSAHVDFPERSVVSVLASRAQLEEMIRVSPRVAEIREPVTPASFFTDLDGAEQRDWCDELLSRRDYEPGASVISILDSGVAARHPLLQDAFSEGGVMAFDPSWDTLDREDHGTRVAGIALYGDLGSALEFSGRIVVTHRLESVKMFDPSRPHDEGLYADVALRAIDRAALANYEENRVYCSAVTGSDGESGGSPTSWSAAIDEAISRPGEEGSELFLVSAGNVDPSLVQSVGYPYANEVSQVPSPGQAWNVVTVGAYADKDVPSEASRAMGYKPLAEKGDLSPYSATSMTWPAKAPIKPEILLPGGNVASDGVLPSRDDDLCSISTSANFASRPLGPFWATSEAVSHAAWMAAEIENSNPNLWPETVRALLVHSASWTDAMKRRYCPDGRVRKTVELRNLLRTCGYGIPNLTRALKSSDGRVNLIIQDELQPFCVKEDGSDAMKDMRFYRLPWPREVLQQLGTEVKARLRVTLSYFIEPGPGLVGSKDRYRYPSHQLRFDVNNPGETEEDFLSRINMSMREDGNESYGDTAIDWYLGKTNRDVGSIHSDFVEQSALELSDIEYVAVYPVIGWWRKRKSLGRINSKARFSLVVTIETPEAETRLYNEVSTLIDNKAAVSIPV